MASRKPTIFSSEHGDPLGAALHQLRLTGTLYCRADLRAPFAVELPQLQGHMILFLVTSGNCEIKVGKEIASLTEGEALLLPHGSSSVARSCASAKVEPLANIPVTRLSDTYETTTYGGCGALTQAVTCILRVEHPAASYLFEPFPEILKLDIWDGADSVWLPSTMHLISQEVRSERPGGVAVVTRLSDVLCVMVLRAFLDKQRGRGGGYLAALFDSGVGQALAQIHTSPEQPWTLEDLARVAGMSRTRFSERFSELVGASPIRYLTEFRMQEARLMLQDEQLKVGELAQRYGYESEAAFSRAFKREVGAPPSAIRRPEVAGQAP